MCKVISLCDPRCGHFPSRAPLYDNPRVVFSSPYHKTWLQFTARLLACGFGKCVGLCLVWGGLTRAIANLWRWGEGEWPPWPLLSILLALQYAHQGHKSVHVAVLVLGGPVLLAVDFNWTTNGYFCSRKSSHSWWSLSPTLSIFTFVKTHGLCYVLISIRYFLFYHFHHVFDNLGDPFICTTFVVSSAAWSAEYWKFTEKKTMYSLVYTLLFQFKSVDTHCL